jgi:hypothetical protein
MAAMPAPRAVATARLAVAALVLALTCLPALASPVLAAPHPVGQDGPDAPADDGTGSSSGDDLDEPLPGNDIVPQPNSGREPDEAGDRGGALQVLVLALMLGGVGGIVALAARDVRRTRARRSAGG